MTPELQLLLLLQPTPYLMNLFLFLFRGVQFALNVNLFAIMMDVVIKITTSRIISIMYACIPTADLTSVIFARQALLRFIV
jgi:hypothetical protein